MKCHVIICITLIPSKGQGVGEMEASHMAMEKKYRNKPTLGGGTIKFVSVKMQESAFDKPDGAFAFIMAAVQKELGVSYKDVINAAEELVTFRKSFAQPGTHLIGGIGLYWACHGNSAEMGPGAKLLAECTANLISEGLIFAKINLNACRSGSEDTISQKAADPRPALEKFCTGLTLTIQQADKKGMVLPKITGLTVAGYDWDIEMFDENSDFYKNIKFISDKDVSKTTQPGTHSVGAGLVPRGRPQNTFTEHVPGPAKGVTIKRFVSAAPTDYDDMKIQAEQFNTSEAKSSQASGKNWGTVRLEWLRK
jgi:hypothetical protein